MDTLSPNNGSKSNSSGSSATSSSMDLKCHKQQQRQREQKLSRSRSFLHLLSKHLGRHFQHHHHQNDTVYSSQDDIRSSSTDSFSLSDERGSHNECHVLNGGSSLDLVGSRASSTSACSRCSPGLDCYEGYDRSNSGHIYVQTVYRPNSVLEQHAMQRYDDDSSSGEDVDDEGLGTDENENVEHMKVQNGMDEQHPRSASAASASGCKAGGGLHLSRISISSSVSRMLHHFSTSAATTATASLRSLSCSSTPLRQPKKSLTPHNSSSSNASSTSSGSGSGSGTSKSAKKQKKQQSILRPPVQYVYMKGMSGLYSRVPSYAVCCPYTLHHMY
ncbi:uncharacterized protein LOC115633013 [Scaptodrosophila lebanonensis]|uniref:Uncharacterized protein LOC115633013 n=1 Tax=Drosophila lebanonensis TaxID=7225 RepID=A0A6J2UFL8_DROLE|nr:uncharacterized protein LOC115633013 [Scaptodrosophila lebanonensis]